MFCGIKQQKWDFFFLCKILVLHFCDIFYKFFLQYILHNFSKYV